MKNLGGSIKVANLIGWQLSYKVKKPRGWWDRATNVQAEMDEFIEDHALPERVLPSKNTFIKAGRCVRDCGSRFGCLGAPRLKLVVLRYVHGVYACHSMPSSRLAAAQALFS